MNRNILIFCLTITILLSSSTASWSDDFQKGVYASQKGEYATAIKAWTPLAEKGDADAQYALGAMYFAGYGVSQDYQTAMKWYTLAAEQGNALAQFNLDVIYHKGHGVLQDHARAYMWFNLSVSTGHEVAFKVRDIVAEQMTPSEIEQAQKLAEECIAKNYNGC